jgi:hypothetical protein
LLFFYIFLADFYSSAAIHGSLHVISAKIIFTIFASPAARANYIHFLAAMRAYNRHIMPLLV